jgi:AcrR family transcriptional regulator
VSPRGKELNEEMRADTLAKIESAALQIFAHYGYHGAQTTEAHYDPFVPLIEEAQRSGDAAPGDPRALAAAFFSFIQGLATLVFQRKGLEEGITPHMLVIAGVIVLGAVWVGASYLIVSPPAPPSAKSGRCPGSPRCG